MTDIASNVIQKLSKTLLEDDYYPAEESIQFLQKRGMSEKEACDVLDDIRYLNKNHF